MALTTFPEKCSGCRLCQLLCALVHFQENNPMKGALRVEGHFPDPGRYTIRVCDDCGVCAEKCPENAIVLQKGNYVVLSGRCTKCGLCVEVCPTGSIFLRDDVAGPIKCDGCLECVPYCPRQALQAAKTGR